VAQPTIKGAVSAAATSVTLPAHVAGDLIVIFTFKDGATTVPTTPAAGGTVPTWTLIDGPTGANLSASKTAYAIATSSTHTTGAWTGATGIVAYVISGADDVNPIGGHAMSGSTGLNTTQAPAITQTATDGSSLILEFFGHRTVTAWSAATAGYTRQTSVATEVCSNTKDSTTSDGAVSQACTATSSGYRGATVEILALNTGVKRVTGGTTTVAQRTTFGITVPSNAVNGDWLYIYLERDAGGTAVTVPSGVTQQATRQRVSAVQGYVFRHKVNGTQGTTLTFSWTGSDWSQAGYDLIRNADGTEPEDVAIGSNDGSSTAPSTASITSVTDNALGLAVCINVDGTTHTPPTGWTEQLDDSHSVSTATLTKTPAGSMGPLLFGLGITEPWVTFLIALKPPTVGGGTTTVTTGLPVELDKGSANAATLKQRTTGQPVVTHTLLVGGRVKVRVTPQALEADAGLATAARIKRRTTAQALEADAVLPSSRLKVRLTLLAGELDVALATAARIKRRITGLPAELDTGLTTAGRVKYRVTALALELEQGLHATAAKVRLTGLAAELDTALAAGRVKRRATQLALELDTALGIAGHIIVTTGLALEQAAALAATRLKRRTTNMPAETDSGLVAGRVKVRATGQPAETATGLLAGRVKRRTTAQALEASVGLHAVAFKRRITGLASETSSALAAGRLKRLVTGIALELELALAAIVKFVRPSGEGLATATIVAQPRATATITADARAVAVVTAAPRAAATIAAQQSVTATIVALPRANAEVSSRV
jgi:hypothetical protein